MSQFKLRDADVEFLRQALRQASIKWPGRAEALKAARKKVFVRKSQSGKSIWKFKWQCAECRNWYREQSDVEVDHIIEIGPFKGDWNEFLFRHFPPDRKNLQVLCIPCHMKKTKAFNSARTRWERKK